MNSISGNNSKYLQICDLASIDDNIFNTFKQNPYYTEILEHTSYNQGLSYLDIISKIFPEYIQYIELFRQNDYFGSPTTYNYHPIGEFSPSTLRYIKVLGHIKSLLRTNFNDKHIIEIGCGYGGQSFIFSQFFPRCTYYIVDLPEVQRLTDKYLNKLNLKNYKILSIKELENIRQYDLVISNYAYSELDIELQNYYFDNIIKYSKHGYFTLNFISDLFKIKSYEKNTLIEKFKQEKDIKVIDEEPKTYNNNTIIYF